VFGRVIIVQPFFKKRETRDLSHSFQRRSASAMGTSAHKPKRLTAQLTGFADRQGTAVL
jgi:hypothetical protein